MTFEIADSLGNYVDISPYIAFKGMGYQLSDIDSTDAGRTMDGTMHRGKITDKEKFTFNCRLLTTAETAILLPLVSREYVTCRYVSPRSNGTVIKTMYVGDRSGTHCMVKGTETLWSDFKFNLIEV